MISGKILRDAIISGANNINNQRSRVDELNVFPRARWRHRHQHGHDGGCLRGRAERAGRRLHRG